MHRPVIAFLSALLFLALGGTAHASCSATLEDCGDIRANHGSFNNPIAAPSSLGTPIDITQSPYFAKCDNPTNPVIDVSATVQAALDTGRAVRIPACPANPVWPWVFSVNINNTGGRNGISCDGGAFIRPAPNSDYLTHLTGFGSYLDVCTISDTDAAGQDSNVVRKATVSAGTGVWGATSLTLANVTGTFKVGQRLEVLLDDGGWFSDNLISVSSDSRTLGFTKRLPFTAADGNTVWASNGLVWVGCGANQWRVSNVTMLGNWTGLAVNCPIGGGNPPSVGTAFNINMNKGQLFGEWCGSGCSANQFFVTNFVGGWINAFTTSGDGTATSFKLGGYRAWSNTNAATNPLVSIAGVPKFYPADWAFSTDGLRIIFTTPPPAGINNIAISFRVFSAEGRIVDTTGGLRASGNMFIGGEFGQADIPCHFTGGIGNVINQQFSNALCGPGVQAAIRFDNAGVVFVSNVEAANADSSIQVVSGAAVKGDLVSIPTLATTMTTGLAGLPFVVDPQGAYTGALDTQSTFGTYIYDRSAFIATNGSIQPTATTATCTTATDTPPGSRTINCSATTGTFLAGQMSPTTATGNADITGNDLNVTATVSGAWAQGQAVYCNICRAGTIIIGDAGGGGGVGHYTLNITYPQPVSNRAMVQGLMPQYDSVRGYSGNTLSLTNRTGATIPAGTVLPFKGPAQPNGNQSERRTPYQRTTPVSGDTVTFGDGVQFAVLQPAAPLPTLTVQLPPCTPDLEAMRRGFSTTADITALTVIDGGTPPGTVITPPTSMTARGAAASAMFLCRGATATWFPAG